MTMPKKVLPLRHCVGCGQSKVKRDLVRIVRTPEGEFALDVTGRLPGRGAYVCRSAECLEQALRRGGLERSFSGAVPEAMKEKLREEFSHLA